MKVKNIYIFIYTLAFYYQINFLKTLNTEQLIGLLLNSINLTKK